MPIRLNPGGFLLPTQVVGRDAEVERLWRVLGRQSALLTAERRMGKTSLLRKMAEEGYSGYVPIMRSVQDVVTPDEFVRHLLTDVAKHCPGVLKHGKSLRARLDRAGVKSVGVAPASIEFSPATEESWKDVVRDTFAALDEGLDEIVVFLWDELPHMIANISSGPGPLAGREMLDLLRAEREAHANVRMVFSGSLGLHHVVSGLRSAGGAWAPVNDMLHVDLPPLARDDAIYLASELLHNEGIVCDDDGDVAASIADQVDCVPYYVHLTIQALDDHEVKPPVGPGDIVSIVDRRLRDPLDRWHLLHYVDRLRDYYGDDASLVTTLLDTVAVAPKPLSPLDLLERLAGIVTPPPLDRLHQLLDLLGKDHYLSFAEDGAVSYRLELLRRAWIARRRLDAV